jgi:hypothetical protein
MALANLDEYFRLEQLIDEPRYYIVVSLDHEAPEANLQL